MLRKLIIPILLAIPVVTLILAFGAGPHNLVGFYRQNLSPTMFSYWAGGLIAYTILPAFLAVLFWKIARRIRHGWIVDILFFPLAWLIQWTCISVMLHAADEPDLDGLTGWATDLSTLFFIISVVAYAVALILYWIRKSRAPRSGPGSMT